MRPSYFLISVSNRKNLDLCIKYALAGFTNSKSGLWTFSDIREGDYISFLYGAKARNLYIVESKIAIKNAETLPPWEPVTFKQSGKTYYFPFRLQLKPIRKLEESLVRVEFAYVAENLLLRGGYRRTHFQADQTTLQSVSQMGTLWREKVALMESMEHETFIPKFTRERSDIFIPEVFLFQELILQAIIRKYLDKEENLQKLLSELNIKNIMADKLEILGEKAFPEGHVDILAKEAVPTGISRKIIIEVKSKVASENDLKQLKNYVDEIGEECMAAILIANKFSTKIIQKAEIQKIKVLKYNFEKFSGKGNPVTFEDLLQDFSLTTLD